MNVNSKQDKIERRLTTILTKISDYANPKCEECDGEGIVSYARGEDAEDGFCQVCFPDGFEDDYDDRGDD